MNLASAERGPVQQAGAQLGVSRLMVRRWQQHFAEEGVDGLLRDKTRKLGRPSQPHRAVGEFVGIRTISPILNVSFVVESKLLREQSETAIT